jgi:hypothetical protein
LLLKVLNVAKILLRRFKTCLFISALALFITGFLLASFADAVSQDISLKNILYRGGLSDLLFLECQISGGRTDNTPYIELKNILREQNLYFQTGQYLKREICTLCPHPCLIESRKTIYIKPCR